MVKKRGIFPAFFVCDINCGAHSRPAPQLSIEGRIAAPQIDAPPSERRALRVFRFAKDLNALRLFSPLGASCAMA